MKRVRAAQLVSASPDSLGCDPESVWVRPAPWWLRLVWRGPFAAIALPWGIYVRATVSEVVIRHELVHMAQWRDLGLRRFLATYLKEYVAGRRHGLDHLSAYAAISLESEARIQAGSPATE